MYNVHPARQIKLKKENLRMYLSTKEKKHILKHKQKIFECFARAQNK